MDNARLTLDPQFIKPLVQLAAYLGDLDGGDKPTATIDSTRPTTATLTIGEREIKLKVYDANVSVGEVLLWTDKGTVTLVVDRSGDRVTWEVFDWSDIDWDLDSEVNA